MGRNSTNLGLFKQSHCQDSCSQSVSQSFNLIPFINCHLLSSTFIKFPPISFSSILFHPPSSSVILFYHLSSVSQSTESLLQTQILISLLLSGQFNMVAPRPWLVFSQKILVEKRKDLHGSFKSWSASKSHDWFKSYGNFAEWVYFAYWGSFSVGGSAINGATPYSFDISPIYTWAVRV